MKNWEPVSIKAFPRREAEWQALLGEWTKLRLPNEVEARWDGTVVGHLRIGAVRGPDGSYVVERLEAVREPGGPPITGQQLRSFPLQRVADSAVREAVGWPATGVPREAVEEVSFFLEVERQATSTRSEAGLAYIAAWYFYLQALGLPQVSVVAHLFGVKVPTVNDWVRRARDQGLIADEPAWVLKPTWLPAEWGAVGRGDRVTW